MLCGFALAVPAMALPTAYEDRASFEAGLDGAVASRVDWDGYAEDALLADGPIDPGPFSLELAGSTVAGRNLIDALPFPEIGASDVDGTAYALLWVTPATGVSLVFDRPVLAFGGDFFGAGNTTPLTITLTTGLGEATYELRRDGLVPSASLSFFGFVTTPDAAITQLTFGNTRNDGFGLDNVAVVAVPEPATFALLVVALCAALAGSRQSR